MSASVAGVATPVTFHATVHAAAASQLVLVSGNNQTGAAGTSLALPLVVAVEDSFGNGVAGTTVTFADTLGGGSVTAGSALTDAQGQAQTTLILGTTPGTNKATATAAGLSGSPLTFSATATAGPAATIARVSGNSQTGTAGTALASPFVVLVTDANNNPVSGTMVTFAVTAGGGSMSASPVATDAAGHASSTLTLGNTAGTNSVQAQVSGLSGSPVSFSATGNAGAAASIALVSGNSQTGTAGSALTNPFVVIVKDAHGNPVSGTTVSWVATGGGGTMAPSSSTTATSTGKAQSTLTLGTTAGTNSVEARVTGLTGSPVLFTSTGIAGPAASIALASGDRQQNVAGATLPSPLVVTVTDANGNLVTGTLVTFSVTTGAGHVSPGSATTAGGSAQTTLTLDAVPGANKVTATAAGVAGNVVFTATGSEVPDYRTHFDFAIARGAGQLVVSDLNQDGKPDVIVADTPDSTDQAQIFINSTTAGAITPSFRAGVPALPGDTVVDLVAADINMDGKPDLVASLVHGGVSVALNTTVAGATTPTFAAATTITADADVLKIIDVDGDGVPDIVTNGSLHSNGVGIYLNQTIAGSMSVSFASGVFFTAVSSDLVWT